MPLNKTSMRDKIKAKVEAVPLVQGSDASAMLTYRDAVLEAMCAGIIEEIVSNAVCETTSGAPDSEHTGKVY
ncbi:MAG: hypothetical protein J7K75_08460 [Desulfuromonas sp.]|nr:hypothetical protein [Desulfuromonas sp.]